MKKTNIFEKNWNDFTFHNPTYQPCAIDTIELSISENYVSEKWKTNKHFQPKYSNGKIVKTENIVCIYGHSVELVIDKSFTSQVINYSYKLRIQQEALSPWANYIVQIVGFIYMIFYSGYITLPIPIESTIFDIRKYILENLENMAKLVRLDIYFDFLKDDIKQVPSYYNGVLRNSSTSPKNGSHRPIWIIYDRIVAIKDKNPNCKWVDSYPFPKRVEMRMDSYNSPQMMNLKYLNGCFLDIFTIFSIHLARSLRRNKEYLFTEVNVTSYNGYFNCINNISNWMKIPNKINPEDLWYYYKNEQYFNYNQLY